MGGSRLKTSNFVEIPIRASFPLASRTEMATSGNMRSAMVCAPQHAEPGTRLLDGFLSVEAAAAFRDEMLMRGFHGNLSHLPAATEDRSSIPELHGQTQLGHAQTAMLCPDESANSAVKVPSGETEVPFSTIKSQVREVDMDSKSSEGDSRSSG